MYMTASVIYTILHFDKYRTIATSFVFTAYGLAAVVSQFVLSGLVDEYALQGALLVFGAILLNSTALVMLARSPSPMRLSWRRASQHIQQNGVNKPSCYGAASSNKLDVRNQVN
ncbi:hypothetical protein MTO96_013082 [Rhipicephalus appendiculatus]